MPTMTDEDTSVVMMLLMMEQWVIMQTISDEGHSEVMVLVP